jgi:hypothetical protein
MQLNSSSAPNAAHLNVIPAEAGIQCFGPTIHLGLLDPGFRRGDGLGRWVATKASGNLPAEPKASDQVYSTWVSQ